MKITRRAALLGVAGGMIGGLPTGALSTPIIHPASPLLPPPVKSDVALLLRSYVPTNPRHEALQPFKIAQYYCNLIAVRSRRGAGNIAMMHPDTLAFMVISSSRTTAWKLYQHPEPVGQWIQVGTMNDRVTLFTSDHMAPMEVMLMYRPADNNESGDFGAILLEKLDGHTLIDDTPVPHIRSSSVTSYLNRIRFHYS